MAVGHSQWPSSCDPLNTWPLTNVTLRILVTHLTHDPFPCLTDCERCSSLKSGRGTHVTRGPHITRGPQVGQHWSGCSDVANAIAFVAVGSTIRQHGTKWRQTGCLLKRVERVFFKNSLGIWSMSMKQWSGVGGWERNERQRRVSQKKRKRFDGERERLSDRGDWRGRVLTNGGDWKAKLQFKSLAHSSYCRRSNCLQRSLNRQWKSHPLTK